MGATGATPGGRGRFPGFDALAQDRHWDDVTRRVVLSRVTAPPKLAFFSDDEALTARALCDRLLAQDDEPRVPVVEMIDARLRARDGDGYRYEDMPEDGDAWTRSLAGLECDARAGYGRAFADLDPREQRALIERVRLEDGDWHGMPGQRLFSLWMRYTATAFYSHPWAWNEIGFPGPAYPRGYKALTLGSREPFERREGDARDPVAWADRVEAAHTAHEGADDRGAS